MVDNPAIHELNNIEVRGGDTDFQVVNIEGTSEDILLEYNDATDEWDIRGTVSDLDVANLEYEFGLHQTEINEDKEIPEGQGSVIAGPLTGTGEITGEGNLAVVDDVQDAVRNPVQENVDFNSNNATGISDLEAESVNTDSLESGGFGLNQRRLLGTYDDTDAETVDGMEQIDVDFTGDHDAIYYELDIVASNIDGKTVEVRLNGDTTDNYQYHLLESGTLSWKTNENEFEVFDCNGGREVSGKFAITAGDNRAGVWYSGGAADFGDSKRMLDGCRDESGDDPHTANIRVEGVGGYLEIYTYAVIGGDNQ